MSEDAIGQAVCGTLVLIVGALILVGTLQYRRNQAAYRLVESLRSGPDVLLAAYSWPGKFQTSQVNGGTSRWKPFVIAVTPGDITLYSRGRVGSDPAPITFAAAHIRWFGRPKKYTYGSNELWIHLETGDGWHLLRIRLHYDAMRDLVRALKAVVPEELVIAYRRRRPYIHAGPAKAAPATQDIHGAWTLDAPVSLYLMPRHLVMLRHTAVLRAILLEHVQQIGAFYRLDQPGAQGLVRFRVEEETLAFALDRHEAFAAALAEAAKRTLEEPVMQKQKKKADDDDFDEE